MREATQAQQNIKDGYYQVSDGVFGLKAEFKNNGETKAARMIEKVIELMTELDDHLGGV